MNEFKVTLSSPPHALKPNHRAHWAKKANAYRDYKAICWLAIQGDLRGRPAPRWKSAVVYPTWHYKGTRPDYDNVVASLKAAFDALEKSLIVLNDQNLLVLPPRMLPGKPQVELIVFPSEITPEEIYKSVLKHEVSS